MYKGFFGGPSELLAAALHGAMLDAERHVADHLGTQQRGVQWEGGAVQENSYCYCQWNSYYYCQSNSYYYCQ